MYIIYRYTSTAVTSVQYKVARTEVATTTKKMFAASSERSCRGSGLRKTQTFNFQNFRPTTPQVCARVRVRPPSSAHFPGIHLLSVHDPSIVKALARYIPVITELLLYIIPVVPLNHQQLPEREGKASTYILIRHLPEGNLVYIYLHI